MRGIRTFLYELKYAFIGIKRNFMLCMSAMSAITVTLLLVGCILVLGLHVNYFSSDIKKDLSIHVVLNDNITSDENLQSLQQEISKIKNVSKVELSSADNELELMIKEKGDAFAVYRGEDNPLSNAFFVYVKDAEKIEKTSDQIEKIDGVSSVAYGGSSVTSLVDMLSLVQKIGLGIVVLLAILSLYLIYNTIRTTIESRKDEIMIMRTVGATNGFVRNPFIVQGIVIGLIGALIPFLALYYGYQALYNSMDGQVFTPMFALFKPMYIYIRVGISILVSGILIGGFASFLAARKYLKMKR